MRQFAFSISLAALGGRSGAGETSFSKQTARTGYRPDIDGLRAVAVLAVVATHAGTAGCSGGFVGVDVFFVISGYLITRNLERQTPASLRGLAEFYGRRMRRTLPALYVVAAITLAAGLVVLLPGELDDLARGLIGTLLFVPNVLYLNQAGYFDHAAASKVLLHTWSLGVEEQFYLIAPLITFGLRRLSVKRRKAALLALFGVDFFACFVLREAAPAAAFYLMPARLWEFVAGALVAEGVIPPLRTPWLAEGVAGVALLGLATAIVWFSDATPHPGLPTLLPCLATAALILAGSSQPTLAGRLLGSRPLAGIGLISYSIYLLHWPLLVIWRTAGWPSMIAAKIVVLAALSVLSWRFVEVPFRAPGSFLHRHASQVLLPAAALLASSSVAIVALRGLPARFEPAIARVAAFYDYADRRDYREGTCFITSRYGDARYFDRPTCLRLATDRPNVLLMGDSHGAHIWYGLKTVLPDANVLQATASGCKPLLATSGKRYCVDLVREVLGSFLPRHHLDVVILSAAWDDADVDRLGSTLFYLRPYVGKVIVLGRIPGHVTPLPTLLARAMLRHDDQLVADQQSSYPFEVDSKFRAALPASAYISLTDALCPAGRCRVWAEPGVPLQFDGDHLTSEGSLVVGTFVRRKLAEAHVP